MQGLGDDRSVKNRWLWQGMERLGIQVLNVAEDDIAELQALGVKLKDSDRFISANLISTKTGEPLLKPYVVKQIALKGSNQKYRVGFLGLSSRESFLKTDAAGYTWADPQASARKMAAGASKGMRFSDRAWPACQLGKPFNWRWTTVTSTLSCLDSSTR